MSTNTTQPPSTPTKSGAHRTNALPSGYVLDEYRIEAILGAGGFGVTYKALDTHLDALVAIKEYFPVEWSFRDADGVMVHANTQGLSSASGGQTSDYEWGLERFLDEARVLARIQHPYVVRVKRYFRANGTAYIVMEYEEGEPLSTILEESGTLHEEEVRGLLEDVMPALQAVHEQGYLHRDIKPANLYVRARDHRVMLIDFGAARAAISRHSQNVTSLVTPGYSPPEQYTTRNDRYGTWTDLYALGAVLYRCVTGHTPAEAAERLLDDHLEAAVAVGGGRYSTNLLRAIDRALAVRPEMRFRDIAEMQAALAGSRDEDSDETVIMAPVTTKTGKAVPESSARSVTRHRPTEPTAKTGTGKEWPEPVQPVVESPRPALESLQPDDESSRPAAGRREVLTAASPASSTPPPRRAPVAILASATAVVAAAALGIWLWWEPSAPPAPPPGSDQHSQAPPVAHSPPPVSKLPESPTPPPPRPTAEPLPVEPAASPTASAPPPAVETTGREPAPAMTPETQPPAGEPVAPLLAPGPPARQPIQFQEEPATAAPNPFQEEPATAAPNPFQEEPATAAPNPFQEEPATPKAPAPAVTTGTAAPPSPAPPALAPSGRSRPPSGTAQQTATKPETAQKAPARGAEPPRAKKAPRPKKERRPRSRTEPAVVTPAKPVQSAPALRTSNPWEAPASTGFNSK